MEIFVQGDANAWNGSRPIDVRAVLTDVVRQFSRHLEQNPLPCVLLVLPGSPFTRHFQTGNDTRSVEVHCGLNDWSRLAYQFAHEFCHLLTVPDRLGNNENNWFLEAICELASVFALKKMSVSWKTHPPYSNWAEYSCNIETYVQKLIETTEKLPTGQSLQQWLLDNESDLRRNAVNRRLNHMVTHALYPVFNANPNLWDALQYVPTLGSSLEEYLRAWHSHAPAKHQFGIASVAREFGMMMP